MTTDAAPDMRPTILVFEDEVLVAMLVEGLLAKAGYRAVWAPDGYGALPAPGAAVPRAAVVDLRLAQGLDGRDVLRGLRERHPGMPAIVVTGYDSCAPEADLRGLGGPTVRLRNPSNATRSWKTWPRCSTIRPSRRRRAGGPPTLWRRPPRERGPGRRSLTPIPLSAPGKRRRGRALPIRAADP